MLLGDTTPPATPGRPATQVAGRLVDAACAHFQVSAVALRSQRRHGNITRARWAIAHVLIDSLGWSLPRIGALLDKDHTSILYGWRRSQQLYREDAEFFDAIAALERVIYP